MFFKGYVETKDKKCIEKFKNRTDFKTFEQVQPLPEFAGILAADTILVDIDDYESSEILFKIVTELELRCRIYRTTRGKHFLFKNSGVETNKTGCKLAIGLTADIKIGTRNSYKVIKYDGKMREVLYDTAENEEAQPLPRWMFPVKSKMEFLHMEVGDGRNQALYNYILTLQGNAFVTEEIRRCIRIINKYVLEVPLDEKEIETILRDDSFKKPAFFQNTTFLFDKFAAFLKNNSHIIRINNQLHIYKDGIYVPGYQSIESEMIRHIPTLNAAKRTEVLKYLEIMIQENTKSEDANLIAFENGLLDIVDDAFIAFTPEHIITNKVHWRYNPEAYSEIADEVLNRIACNDVEIRALLEEAIGYCFYRRNELGKCFILIGDKSNGKSTFLSMIQTLLGDENIASLDLKELGDRFKTAELFGKLANIGDDIGDEFIPNAAIFRKLVTGDRVSAERKGQNPFEFNNYSKFLFSANNIPRIKDKTGAVQRRLVIIPFEATFSKTLPDGSPNPNFNPYIKHLLKTDEVMEYLISIGIQGLKRVLENRAFTVSSKVQKEMDEYEESNNPVLGFIKECKDENFAIINEPTQKVYKRYREYCIENSLQPMSNGELSKQINRLLNTTTEKIIRIDKKQYRIYSEKD